MGKALAILFNRLKAVVAGDIDEYMAKGGYHKPEIVVVTDGDDKITLKAADFPGTKVHGFLVERTNRALVDFCRETGGIAIDNL